MKANGTEPRKLDVRKLHPEVRKMYEMLNSEFTDATGLQHGMWRHKVLRVKVSHDQLLRALAIMDTLVRKLESRGAKFVRIQDSDKQEMRIDGERIECVLIEETKRDQFVGGGISGAKRCGFKSTGLFRFQVEQYTGKAGKRVWSDLKEKKLESQVDEIVEGLFKAAADLKEFHRQIEEQRRQWERERQLREEAERKKAVELNNRKLLEQQAEEWLRSKNLRAFIDACEHELHRLGTDGRMELWAFRWLVWAKEHAHRIDPLQNGYLENEKTKWVES